MFHGGDKAGRHGQHRYQHPHDTGDAQWFINLKDNPRLVRDYTVFAEVVDGIAVVDGILEGDVVATMREIHQAVYATKRRTRRPVDVNSYLCLD